MRMLTPFVSVRCCIHHCRHVLHHPVDNQFFRYNNPPGAKTLVYNAPDPRMGSAWHFGHFYAAGCSASKTISGSPTVTCPPNPIAPTCKSPYATVVGTSSYNDTNYYAMYNNAAGFGGVIYLAGVASFKETWTWKNVRLPSGGWGVAFEQAAVFGTDETWAAGINAEFTPALLGRATGNDVQLYLAQFILHEIQSFGWLPNWLPNVCSGRTTAWEGGPVNLASNAEVPANGN